MGFDDIIDYIAEGFSGIGDVFGSLFSSETWGNSEVFSSPKFWIPVVAAGGLLYYVLNSWQGKVEGLTGYAVVGGIVVLVWGYFWAARDIEKNG